MVKDFAVLLSPEGKPTSLSPTKEDNENTPNFPLTLVVFNGDVQGFKPVFQRLLSGPRAAFIRFDKKLYYGIFEMDSDTFEIVPYDQKYTLSFKGRYSDALFH